MNPSKKAAAALGLGCAVGLGLAGCGPAGGGAAPNAPAGQAAAAASGDGAPDPSASSPAVPSAAQFRGAEAERAAAYLAEPRYAQADAKRGALLVLACKACHAIDPGETNDHAPRLAGVIGRVAGSRGDFDYSDALKASGIVWTPAAIEAWLANPANFVPGTKMKFTGFASAEDRRDVVAYLLRHAGSAGKAPSAAASGTADGAAGGEAGAAADAPDAEARASR